MGLKYPVLSWEDSKGRKSPMPFHPPLDPGGPPIILPFRGRASRAVPFAGWGGGALLSSFLLQRTPQHVSWKTPFTRSQNQTLELSGLLQVNSCPSCTWLVCMPPGPELWPAALSELGPTCSLES